MCYDYLQLPIELPTSQSCSNWKVPRFYHAVGKTAQAPPPVVMNAAANPQFELVYRGDADAREFVLQHCGKEAAASYDCFVAPAYRADLYRYCVLHAVGGVYLDSDLVLTKPMEQAVSMCDGASLGHDIPQLPLPPKRDSDVVIPGMQMKILAGTRGHPLFKCMLDEIVRNVKTRFSSRYSLLLTGPSLLARCYMALRNSSKPPSTSSLPYKDADAAGWPKGYFDGVAKFENRDSVVRIVYRDSRAARWPYTGMVGLDGLVAFEIPAVDNYRPGDLASLANATHDQVARSQKHYHELMMQGIVFKDTCSI